MKKSSKKYIPKKVTIIFLVILCAGASGLTYALIVSGLNKQEEVSRIEPGELPEKKSEGVATEESMTPEQIEEQQVQATYPVELSLEQASQITVVVNKKHKLPNTYAPVVVVIRGSSLRPEAASALEVLLANAESSGFSPKIISGYRSYQTQASVYGNYVSQYGQDTADTFSARPGHSEHQTGLAVDLGNSNGSCDLEVCFGTTPLGIWLAQNSHVYGFVVRYPEGKETITGYQYEPWHLRYIGSSDAGALYSSAKTMDEFYGIPAGMY